MDDSTIRSPAGFLQDLGMSRAQLQRFLARPRVAVLSWVATQGRVDAAPMWFACRDGLFLLHTGHPSSKTKAILKNDRVALTIQDVAPPYRYVTVRGQARLRQEPEEALRLYREQAYAYYGKVSGRFYLQRVLADFTGEHVIIEITPQIN